MAHTHLPIWLVCLGKLSQQKYIRLNLGSILISLAQPLLMLYSILLSVAQFYSALNPSSLRLPKTLHFSLRGSRYLPRL